MTPRPPKTAPSLTRRRFLAVGAAGAAAPMLLRVSPALASAGPTAKAFGFPEPDLRSVVVRPIAFPVEGTVHWSDTYGACRDGCSRHHEGQDLLGKKLQKLLACVDGTVVALRHRSDGNSLYLQDADGWYYAYLHINNDTPGTDDGKNPLEWAFVDGLKEGDKVTRGQHVAYMGDSGNAENSGAHCHFEIRRPTSKGVWHSQSVNPKPSLDAADASAANAPAAVSSAGPYVPFATAAALITRQYRDILGRDPSKGSLDLYEAVLDGGQHGPAWVMATLLDSTENQDTAGAVTRLYRAYFNRDPDLGGFSYWLRSTRDGGALDDASEYFARSSEFIRTYGPLDDALFVSTVYENVLGRNSDPDGQAYWVDQLDRRLIGRGRLMLRFSESSENRAKLSTRVTLFLMNAQLLGVAPSSALVAIREKQLTTNTITIEKLVDGIRLSDEYAARLA